MTDLRQAAQQALEALEELDGLDTETECVTIDVGDVIAALRTALEQQAEPSQWRDMVVVSLVREGVNKHKARELADHFAASPQRQWQGLTDEDMKDPKTHILDFIYGARWAEAKLKERNNG